MNLLSCPKSIYGIGGIGAQSFAPFGSKRNLLILNKAIKDILPADFLKQNKVYQYKPIKTTNEEQQVNRQISRKISDEISFNYLFTLSPESQNNMIPTQIPVVLPEGFYIPNKWGLDPDILEYQMTALLIQPNINQKLNDFRTI